VIILLPKIGLVEKAVILYMKGKQYMKAMKLAQKAKLSEYIKKINQEIA
jgi:intraflagellar transport protein 140